MGRVRSPGEYVHGSAGGCAAGDEIGLGAVVFKDQAKVIPAESEVNSQLGGKLPIVVEVRAVVVFSVVREVDVGGINVGGSDDIIGHSAGHSGRDWGQQECGPPGVAVVHVGHFREIAVVIEFSVGPRWLQCGQLDMLPLETHLERVLAVNFGKVVRQLERGADFIRSRKELLPKVESPLIPKAGSPPFFATWGISRIPNCAGRPSWPATGLPRVVFR